MHAITKRAVAAFKVAVLAERKAEIANEVLNRLVPQIPPEELGEYIRQTEAVR